MKKFLIIFLSVILILSGSVFAYVKTGHSLAFLENYYTNFTENVMNLRIRHEMKKAEKEENKLNSENEETDIIDTEDQQDSEDRPIDENPSSDETPNEISEDTVSDISSAEASDNEEEPEYTSSENQTFTNIESLPKTFELNCDPIALNGAANMRFENYMNDILCVSENTIVLYNKNGEKKWSDSLQLSKPVLKVNGTYILIFEQGGKKINVFNGKKLLFAAETEENILTGNISGNGDCVIVREKKYYKGAVSVYNKSGQEIYSRSFGEESIISAAISDSRTLAVSLLSTSNEMYSKISFFDINKTSSDTSKIYNDCVIFDIDFTQNTLFAYGNDKLLAINTNGKEIWDYEYNNKTLSHYRKDKSDVRLLLFDTNNIAELSVISASGRERKHIKTDIIPDFCDICDGYIIYNSERSLYLTKINGAPLAKYTASRDIKKAYFINSDNILIVYNSSIEFLNIKKESKK